MAALEYRLEAETMTFNIKSNRLKAGLQQDYKFVPRRDYVHDALYDQLYLIPWYTRCT